MGGLGAAAGFGTAAVPQAGGAAAEKAGKEDKGKGPSNLGVQRPGFGGGGQGGQGRTVLTMEDLGMAVGEYGINVKRGSFTGDRRTEFDCVFWRRNEGARNVISKNTRLVAADDGVLVTGKQTAEVASQSAREPASSMARGMALFLATYSILRHLLNSKRLPRNLILHGISRRDATSCSV